MQRQANPALTPLINFLSDPIYWIIPKTSIALHQPSNLLPGAIGIMLHSLRTSPFQLEKFQQLAKAYVSKESADPRDEIKRKLAEFCDIVLGAASLSDIEHYISSINHPAKLV